MPVVVVPVQVVLVEPALVLGPELVVEDDAVDLRAELVEVFGFASVGAIDLDVVFQFPLASEALVERLAGTLVPCAMALQEATPFLREHDGMVAGTRNAMGLDEALLAEMPEMARTRIELAVAALTLARRPPAW
jgi:hypothetical protein